MRPIFAAVLALTAVGLTGGRGRDLFHPSDAATPGTESAARIPGADLAEPGPPAREARSLRVIGIDPSRAAPAPASSSAIAEAMAAVNPGGLYEFYFTRGIYSGYYGRSRWATDYPKADEQFVSVLGRLIDIRVAPYSNAISLADPDLRRFPFLYILEVGSMALTEAEAKGLRDYAFAGGFVVVDDFWGTVQWANFEQEMRLVFPDHPIQDVPLDHPVFHMVYDIDEIVQVPARGNTIPGYTYEQDGYVPYVRGIFDDDGRLMVLINANTDLGDAWEWAEQPDYPLYYSTYAFQMGVNFVVYGMAY